MKTKSEDAGMRACRHLQEMVVTEMAHKLADRYAKHGVIGSEDLACAVSDVESAIADFERSPMGQSTRNALVLALVRRTCSDRLREVVRCIERSRAKGEDLNIEELKAA